jgi:post-segregation antitoxin (ccd killing protein)
MGYDQNARKRPVNVSLTEELVRKGRTYTPKLSGTAEELIESFVEREAAPRQAEDAALDELIDTMNAFHLKHGLLSDEFPSL